MWILFPRSLYSLTVLQPWIGSSSRYVRSQKWNDEKKRKRYPIVLGSNLIAPDTIFYGSDCSLISISPTMRMRIISLGKCIALDEHTQCLIPFNVYLHFYSLFWYRVLFKKSIFNCFPNEFTQSLPTQHMNQKHQFIRTLWITNSFFTSDMDFVRSGSSYICWSRHVSVDV